MLKNVKLKELGEIFTGSTPSKKNKEFYNSEDIMFIKPDILDFDIVNIGVSNEYISEKAREKARIIPANSLLVSCIGSIGKLGINEKEVAFNQQINAIVPNNKIKSSRYLAYLLKYNQKKLESIANAPVVPIINKTQFSEFEVLIHENLNFQEQITQILDKSKEIIEKRKEQIQFLDKLVKSKFIEMFGDPVTNLKKWDKVAIGEMFEIKTGATPSRKENSYWEGGTIPWVKTTELKEYIINETEEYITEDGFNNSSVNLLPKDTILIAMYGQGKTRGMTGKLGIEATTNQACAAILPNNNENMDFVWYQLRLLYDELRALGQGGSQPNLNTNLVKTYQLIFPPVELQNEFERFIKHIDKLKFEMEKSLKELEDNFNSLMQKAFRGELFK
ncbi:restriction endonuclease subunit S [Clostridium perfringens]|uniref:Restriction endonuclease subunit S n=1 Tax=Clostridium perfringens TaxID=1502 RepID=A0AAW9HVA0_CLOPF|nr:restriction endonuclease subunit S [Clostridium perfringens]MDZ4909383.1 restriction endonuclease subunit S [Clostridium perfringens]